MICMNGGRFGTVAFIRARFHMILEEEWREDPSVMKVIEFLEEGVPPEDEKRARKVVLCHLRPDSISKIITESDCRRSLQGQNVGDH